MPAPDKIIQLIERFERNKEAYKSHLYNETQARREFIDPLFAALGWDMNNEKGKSDAYKDVIHEDSIKVGGMTKAPDYCFRIGGTRKFFVEAKKPYVNIKDNPEAAYQLRRYGWNQKLPLSILTDFDEFSVYDCRIRPQLGDKASTARIMYFTYHDYVDKWDTLASIFSIDGIEKGSFDKFAESKKDKMGTQEVDDAFLQEIESWREILAKNIALRNVSLTARALNDAVQKTIDRIIFLRICEDRNIEEFGQLQKLLNVNDIYSHLRQIFLQADDKYNSGLFHFNSEKNRLNPDNFTLEINIDDKPLKDILKRLYYPESPYEFSIIPIEILGQVYERFLGKVIRLTAGHQAKVEEKPEVRKAGGVYYTPQYIVEYIVKNTVGKLIENKTPEEAKKLSILDPACGSGSFLIGAYNYLLDWYLQQYSQKADKYLKVKNSPIYQSKQDEYKLTISEKKDILLSNIYGVDIDSQAVEVSKLSLILKALEGETDKSLSNQFRLFKERALPDLCNNIKCGNSLIGPDFYSEKALTMFNEEDFYKINAFDWEKEFPEVFETSPKEIKTSIVGMIDKHLHAAIDNIDKAIYHTDKAYEYVDELSNLIVKEPVSEYQTNQFNQGGFDVIIGNPPYFNLNTINDINEIEYFKKKYSEIHTGYNDIFYYFIYKSILLLNNLGLFGMITANYYIGNSYSAKFREFLLNYVVKIINFKDFYVFKKANVHTNIILMNKTAIMDYFEYFEINPEKFDLNLLINEPYENIQINKNELKNSVWLISDNKQKGIIKKILSSSIELRNYILITKGITSGNRDIFTVDEDTVKNNNFEINLLKKSINSSDIKRYLLLDSKKYLIYIDSNTDIDKYLNIKNYLNKFKSELKNRNEVKQNLYPWYRLERPRTKEIFETKYKLVVPYRSPQNNFALDTNGGFNDGGGSYSLILKQNSNINILFLLGLLNSKLLDWYYGFIGKSKGNMREYFNKPLEIIPIIKLDLSNLKDIKQHNRMVFLVEQMLGLKKREHHASLTSHEKEMLIRQIEMTDKQIDTLVYELYGLTDDEIKVVEGEV